MRDFKKLTEGLRYCDDHYEPTDCKQCPIHKECNEHDAYTRSLAADAIEELSKRADKLGEELTAAMELVHKRNEKIEELLAAVPHWISVEERLPEPYQNVLTCALKLFGADRRIVYGIDCTIENGEWVCGGESYKTMVTHWMPLPSAPKEDAHEQSN